MSIIELKCIHLKQLSNVVIIEEQSILHVKDGDTYVRVVY